MNPIQKVRFRFYEELKKNMKHIIKFESKTTPLLLRLNYRNVILRIDFYQIKLSI